MAHFAKLDENNVVIDVNVVLNQDINDLPFPESEPVGIQFLTNWSGGYINWKQTSYNNSFRKRYAGIGYTYNPELDAFIEPKPYPSWVLNNESCSWEAPIPCPTDGGIYGWDEENLSWIQLVPPKPYPSWVLNEQTRTWEAPIPYPTDGKNYVWDEPTLSWVESQNG